MSPCVASPHEGEPAGELLAGQVHVQLTLGDGLGRILVLVGRGPRAPVPDDDVAAAVLALADHALEVEVLDRVVLDVDGEALGARVERRALGHGPRHEDAVHLEAEVVVQAGGPVALHHEATLARRRVGGGRRAPGLVRPLEVPHLAVLRQPLVDARCLDSHPSWLPRRSAGHQALRSLGPSSVRDPASRGAPGSRSEDRPRAARSRSTSPRWCSTSCTMCRAIQCTSTASPPITQLSVPSVRGSGTEPFAEQRDLRVEAGQRTIDVDAPRLRLEPRRR